MIRSFKYCFLIVFICASTSWAQRKPLDFFAAVKGDSVFLFFNQSPRIGQGFLVERKGPKAAGFERLTKTPINAVTDAVQARVVLGNDYESLAAALKAGSAEQLLVKLKTDPYFGQVATLINRRASIVLGRFFAHGGHRSGAVYHYRLSRVDRSGKALESVDKDLVIRENPPMPVKSLTCRQEKLSVVIGWDYPEWSGDFKDLAFQFMLFRSSDGKKFRCIHDRPILRLEGMPRRYEDQGVAMGLKYTYRMVAVDAAGLISKPVEFVVNTRDLIPPLRPGGLIAHAAKNQKTVSLNWNRNSDHDLAGYNIYRWAADKKDSVRINPKLLPPEQLSFTDSAMAVGTVHYFAVTAVDASGNESEHSDRGYALVTDRTPPRPPTMATARIEGRTVRLSWRPSPDPDAAGYHVRRGYDEKNAFKLHTGLVKDTIYVHDGDENNPINPGEHYYYSVVAVDTMSYESTPVGTWISIPDHEAPVPPGTVIASNHLGREIVATWDPSLSMDVDQYRVYRVMGRDTTALDTVPKAGERVSVDHKIAKGQSAAYAVTAVDTAGNESLPSVSDPVRLRDFDPPTATAYVTAAAAERGVRIRWEPVGDFDLAGYNVYRSTLPTGVMEKVNSALLTNLEFNDPNGTTRHWYRIRSVDTSGNESEASKAVRAQANR